MEDKNLHQQLYETLDIPIVELMDKNVESKVSKRYSEANNILGNLSDKNLNIDSYFQGKNFFHILAESCFWYKEELSEKFIQYECNFLLKTRELLPMTALQLGKISPNDKFIKLLYSNLKFPKITEYEIKTSDEKDSNISRPENWQDDMFHMGEEESEELPLSLTDESPESVVSNPTLLKTLNIIIKKLNLKNIDIIDYANFTVPRAALHATIIYLTMKIQFSDDEDFRKTVIEVYNNHILKIDFLEINQRLDAIEFDYLNRIREVIEKKYTFDTAMEKACKEAYSLITEWIETEELNDFFKQENNKESLLKGMVFSKLLHNEVYDLLYENVIEIIEKYLEENKNKFKKLTYKVNSERVSWTILGGPGSGKSFALVNQIKTDLNNENENIYSDICHINPDTYKELLVNSRIISKFDKKFHRCLEYVHEESSFISKKIIQYLEKSINNDKGPNILFDTVKPNETKTKLANYQLATSYFYIASCPVNIALERAYDRFLKTGRPVPFKVLLEGHKQQSKIIEHIKSGDHFVYIFDTGEENPSRIAMLEGSKEMWIENFSKMLEFVSKEKINSNAKSFAELYGEKNAHLDIKTKIELLMKYVEAKITIKLCLPNSKDPYAVISSEGVLTIVDLKIFIDNVANKDEKNAFTILYEFLQYKNTQQRHVDFIVLGKLTGKNSNSNFHRKILVIKENEIVSCVESVFNEQFKDFFSCFCDKYEKEIENKNEVVGKKRTNNNTDFFKSDKKIKSNNFSNFMNKNNFN